MVTVHSIIDFVEKCIQQPFNLNKDEDMAYGNETRPIRKVVVCWMATAETIEYAGTNAADLILAHENFFYPHGATVQQDSPQEWQHWQTNQTRLELLSKYDIAAIRMHGSLDQLCILDIFAELLQLGKPIAESASTSDYIDRFVKIFQVSPLPFHELIEHVKHYTGMQHVRFSAPQGLDQTVTRIGLPWGGMGLSCNIEYLQKLIAMQCDVFIAGESDNYAARFAAECGIPIIETDHEVSENPGLEKFAAMLQKHFPELDVLFYRNPRIWNII